jgi:hypothetical protein
MGLRMERKAGPAHIDVRDEIRPQQGRQAQERSFYIWGMHPASKMGKSVNRGRPEPRSGSLSIARGERSEPRVTAKTQIHHSVVAQM